MKVDLSITCWFWPLANDWTEAHILYSRLHICGQSFSVAGQWMQKIVLRLKRGPQRRCWSAFRKCANISIWSICGAIPPIFMQQGFFLASNLSSWGNNEEQKDTGSWRMDNWATFARLVHDVTDTHCQIITCQCSWLMFSQLLSTHLHHQSWCMQPCFHPLPNPYLLLLFFKFKNQKRSPPLENSVLWGKQPIQMSCQTICINHSTRGRIG